MCYTVVSLVAVSKALLRLPQKTSGSCDDAILSAGKLILTHKVILYKSRVELFLLVLHELSFQPKPRKNKVEELYTEHINYQFGWAVLAASRLQADTQKRNFHFMYSKASFYATL